MCNKLRSAGQEQAIDIYLASPILGRVTATARAANHWGPVTVPLPPPPHPTMTAGPPNRGTMSPTLYEQCVGSLKSQRIYYMCKDCETGPTVYLPHPSRLKILTVCRCLEKGSTFFSVILIPWVLVQPATRSADQRLSNWANRLADNRERGRGAG